MIGPAKILISLLACILSDATPATYQVQAAPVPLVINELMAANDGFFRDPQGQADDWVEIYNPRQPDGGRGRPVSDGRSGDPHQVENPLNPPSLTKICGRRAICSSGSTVTRQPGSARKFSNWTPGDDQIALFDNDGATLLDRVAFGSR